MAKHAPWIAGMGDLIYCSCATPDWDSAPSEGGLIHPADPDYQQKQEEARNALAEWQVSQPFYLPDDYVAHVLADQEPNIPVESNYSIVEDYLTATATLDAIALGDRVVAHAILAVADELALSRRKTRLSASRAAR